MSKLQKKPSVLKRGHPNTSKHELLQIFFTFVGHFCPPGSGSGFRIRIRIHWPDWIRIRSGSETLLSGLYLVRESCKILIGPAPFICKASRFFLRQSPDDIILCVGYLYFRNRLGLAFFQKIGFGDFSEISLEKSKKVDLYGIFIRIQNREPLRNCI